MKDNLVWPTEIAVSCLSFRHFPSSFSHPDLHVYLLLDDFAIIITDHIRICWNRTKV